MSPPLKADGRASLAKCGEPVTLIISSAIDSTMETRDMFDMANRRRWAFEDFWACSFAVALGGGLAVCNARFRRSGLMLGEESFDSLVTEIQCASVDTACASSSCCF